jgi:hypothetical protein
VLLRDTDGQSPSFVSVCLGCSLFILWLCSDLPPLKRLLEIRWKHELLYMYVAVRLVLVLRAFTKIIEIINNHNQVDVILTGGFFGFLCMYFIQDCFIFRPSDSTVSEDAGIKSRTVETSALAVRRSITTRLHLIHTRLHLIHTRLHLIQTGLHLIHTRLHLIHSRLHLIHNSATSHPRLGYISSLL